MTCHYDPFFNGDYSVSRILLTYRETYQCFLNTIYLKQIFQAIFKQGGIFKTIFSEETYAYIRDKVLKKNQLDGSYEASKQ